MPIDAGEGIYQGLAALASGIARRKQLDYESELQRQAQDIFSRLSRSGFTTESVPYEQKVSNPFFGGIQGMQETQPPSQETVASPFNSQLVGLMGQLASNPKGADMLNAFLKAREGSQKKVSLENQEYGGLQQVTQYPSGRTKFEELRAPDTSLMRSAAMGGPTELAKYQNELMAIKKANPNDPRIPEYEAVIKKLQIGVPNYQPRVGDQGQYLTWDAKGGQWVPSPGPTQYSPTPTQIRDAASKLQNVKDSATKIEELVNKHAITGPFTGRTRKLGTKVFSDKDAQALINLTGQLRPIIYGLSGKQINESELKWLNEEILPKIAQPDENFDITLSLFKGWVDQTLNNMQNQFPSLKVNGKSGSVRFNVNGEMYDIPESEVEEFKKEYPNATRQ